jgi:hypothetical protein
MSSWVARQLGKERHRWRWLGRMQLRRTYGSAVLPGGDIAVVDSAGLDRFDVH